MAMNINNWKNLDSSKAFSKQLQRTRGADIKKRMTSMRRLHVRRSVRLIKTKLQMSQLGKAKVAARTPLQAGQQIRRAHTPALRQAGTQQGGEQKLLQQQLCSALMCSSLRHSGFVRSLSSTVGLSMGRG